jgi:hypothetical protein
MHQYAQILPDPVTGGTARGRALADSRFIDNTNLEATAMKALALTLNVLGFTALFLAYATGASVDRPTGVRRALQTYAGQLPTGAFPTLKPVWELGVKVSSQA